MISLFFALLFKNNLVEQSQKNFFKLTWIIFDIVCKYYIDLIKISKHIKKHPRASHFIGVLRFSVLFWLINKARNISFTLLPKWICAKRFCTFSSHGHTTAGAFHAFRHDQRHVNSLRVERWRIMTHALRRSFWNKTDSHFNERVDAYMIYKNLFLNSKFRKKKKKK